MFPHQSAHFLLPFPSPPPLFPSTIYGSVEMQWLSFQKKPRGHIVHNVSVFFFCVEWRHRAWTTDTAQWTRQGVSSECLAVKSTDCPPAEGDVEQAVPPLQLSHWTVRHTHKTQLTPAAALCVKFRTKQAAPLRVYETAVIYVRESGIKLVRADKS